MGRTPPLNIYRCIPLWEIDTPFILPISDSASEGSWIGDKSPEIDGRRIEDDLETERLVKTGTMRTQLSSWDELKSRE